MAPQNPLFSYETLVHAMAGATVSDIMLCNVFESH